MIRDVYSSNLSETCLHKSTGYYKVQKITS